MKVIGIVDSDKIICEIDKSELEKFFNCYYNNGSEKSKEIRNLKAGSVINLAAGYDHHTEILSAIRELKSFVKQNDKILKAISSGLLLTIGDEALSKTT